MDPEARLESLERRARAYDPPKPDARFSGPPGAASKPPPLEPWSKRLEGKSGAQSVTEAGRSSADARCNVPAFDAAWQLWIGEEGVLWWANKIAWTLAITVIVGWVIFRIVGCVSKRLSPPPPVCRRGSCLYSRQLTARTRPAAGLYTLKAGFTDLPGGSVI